MRAAITVDQLTKTYPGRTALSGVSFSVPERTTFALFGEPGRGKTTAIGCLSTRITPTSGTVLMGRHRVGADDRRIRREVGVVAQESPFDPARTVWENLLTHAELQGYSGRSVQRRIEQLCGELEIMGVLDRRFGNLPIGFRRRADIVGALVHEPSVLLLDEPTRHLDADARNGLWDAMGRLTTGRGLTMVLTTRDAEDAERADAACTLGPQGSSTPAADGTGTDSTACTEGDGPAPTVVQWHTPLQTVTPQLHAPADPRSRTGDELRLLLHDPTALSLISAYDIEARGDVWVLAVCDWAEAREILRMLDGAITDFDFVPGSVTDSVASQDHAAPARGGRHPHLRAVTAS